MRPHNVPFVALGAGLLWFGWFGFNAGSELTVDGTTVIAFINTQVATGAALVGWVAVELQSDPLRAWLVYQAAQSPRRSMPVTTDGDEMIITLTETGGLQITLGTTT